jgi:tetratricopeptide (TPR) repeat protein
MYLGNHGEAEKYLISGKANADAQLIYALYNSTGEYDKGINMLEDLIKNNKSYFDIHYYDSLAQLYLQSGKYDDAIRTYKASMDRVEEMREQVAEDQYFVSRKEELDAKINRIEQLKDNPGIVGTCKGRATVDGIGIEGVKVYIKDKAIYKEDYFSSTPDFPFIVTDKDGYYFIDNVLPGEYDIGIGISPGEILGKAYLDNKDSQKVLEPGGVLTNNFVFNTAIEILSPDDKIEVRENKLVISWQQMEGAESYGLVTGLINEGSYASSIFVNDIKKKAGAATNEITIDIGQIIPEFMGFASFYDEGRPTPDTLLGLYDGARVLYGIEAYSKDGRLIGSSMPVIKTEKLPRHFVLVTQELEGDKLVKEEKYEEARDWFEDYLFKNPEDEHSLYVLARYYEYCEKNYDKAKEYLSRLYDITKKEEYKKQIERMDKAL